MLVLSPRCLLCWDESGVVMFEIHSVGNLYSSSWVYLKTRFMLSVTNTNSSHLPSLPTGSVTPDPGVPLLLWGTFQPCQHFRYVWSKVMCPLPFLIPSSFSPLIKKTHGPFSRGMSAPTPLSLFLSDSFTHSVWHQPSPRLLPCAAFISVCTHLLFLQTEREQGVNRGNEKRMCICCWFRSHRPS